VTPAQSLDARAAAPTPSGGVQIAPRPRRADYLLTAAVGLVLPPLIMAPLGIASYFAAHHRLPWALLLIALALAVCSMAQGFFAVRSSLGGLVAGLVALAVHAVVLCAPQGAQSSPMPWARAFIPTGALLIAAGVLLGGQLVGPAGSQWLLQMPAAQPKRWSVGGQLGKIVSVHVWQSIENI